ncbi:MAG: hydroxymethylbilane synthase [Nitrososphaerales archaeon]
MNVDRPVIMVGTRASPLALSQTQIVVSLLKRNNGRKNLDFKIRKFKTEGDRALERPKSRASSNYTGKDSFTKSIDAALECGEIDIAVHSLKDVPLENSNSKIEIAAFPKRESPFDVLITRRSGETFATLRKNARIGTSSIRRAVQLRASRPDLEIVTLHGNVQTRIKKLQSSTLDAIVLAKAGIKRLGLDIGEILPKEIMLPAVGQGCLAIAVRKNDAFTKKIVSKIDAADTRCAVTAERAFSKELGGGCNFPIAALATIKRTSPRKLFLDGLVESDGPEGVKNSNFVVRMQVAGSPEDAEYLGKKLARQLKKFIGGK